MRALRVLALGFLALAAPAAAGDLPPAKEQALRELLTKVLAEPDSSARKALAATATGIVGDTPFADVVSAVRKGPVLPKGLPKARKVAGKTEDLTTVGTTVVGYSFDHAGEPYRYAVDVPKAYDASRPFGVLLDPGHVSAKGKPDAEKAGFLSMWRRFLDEGGFADWLVVRTEIIEQIGGDGERGERPEDEVAEVFDACFRDLASRFRIDPDRIVVSGVSQTGYWAWYLGAFRADRFQGIAPMSAVTWHVNRFAGNFLGLRTYVLHGEADKVCPVTQPRATCALLERTGCEVHYREIAGAAHEYSVWQNLPAGLTWLAQKPRERYPRRVSKSVRNVRGPWRAWLRIDGVANESKGEANLPPVAGVDGEIDGQTVRVLSENVPALTVCLSSEMLDLEKPVTIVWNGRTAHEGVVKRSAATLFEIAGEKCDWTATFEAAVSLRR